MKEEIIILVNGPMVGRRKVVEAGVSSVTFSELDSGEYVRTEANQGGESCFEYRA